MKGFEKLNPLSRWMLLLAAGIILYTFWLMMQPFALTVLTAAIFAILFSQFDRWLSIKVKSRYLSAFLIVLGVLLVIVIPVGVIAAVVVQQASDLLQSGFLQTAPAAILETVHEIHSLLPPFVVEWVNSLDVSALPTAIISWLQENVGGLIAGGANFVLQMFIFFAFLYYFLLHKDEIRKEIFELSPFKDKLDQGIISRISGTVRGVIVGAIIIAFVQAALASIGLTIFGVPKGVLWGSFALIAAQIPMVGVSLVMVPGILYLLVTGNAGAAIGLTIWSVVVVGLIDNLLSPFLVGRRTKMPELFVLLSVLGGLATFWAIGFIIGPVILACVLVLRDLYRSGALS